jgi:LysR family transcriptional regulator, regulator for metE and metH
MELDLRDLTLLDALAEGRTLTAAAEKLYVSQPALSQRLTKMEHKLGVELFERRGRTLVPNPAGRRMLTAARHVLTELASAQRDVRELGDANRRIKFTSQCTTTFQWLPPIIRDLRAELPDVEIRFEAAPGDQPIPALLDGTIDVALVTKPDKHMDRVQLSRLFDDEMVAVVASSHPWADRKHVTARDFDDVHLVLCDAYDQTRIPAAALPIPHGSHPGRITTMPMITDLLIEMVASGQGISVLPNWVVQPYLASHDIKAVQIGAKPQKRIWFCATRLGPQPEHIEAFVEQLNRHLPQIEQRP